LVSPNGNVFSSSFGGVDGVHVWSVSESSVWLARGDILSRNESRPLEMIVLASCHLAGD
jgi:hypothetical protein